MKKFFLGLVIGIIIGSLAFAFLPQLFEKKSIEGVYVALPAQSYDLSVYIRNDGKMLLTMGNAARWYDWRIEQGKIIARAISDSLKGKEITFTVEGDDLFLVKLKLEKRR
jgi:hypothetical protein